MEILWIVSAMRRSKGGAVLIGLQIAVTLAIVANALFISFQQFQYIRQPSGIDEENIVSFSNVWTGSPQDLKARLETDLAALRSLAGVQDAYATDSLPLRGAGYGSAISLRPAEHPGVPTALYPVDEHGAHTLGLRLVGGRWFNSSDILDWSGEQDSPDHAPVIIVTQALANSLAPGGNALGKTVYIGTAATTIIGIVERMQAPGGHGHDKVIENSALTPYLWADSAPLYVLRAQPGRRDEILQAAQRKLIEINRARAMARPQTFHEMRATAYRPFRATALILLCVSVVLVVITGLGVVGLTSFWVTQRQRQIGIRRALGARWIDILRYFHLENLLIVGAGVTVGLVLAIGVNLLVVSQFGMARIPGGFVLTGAFFVLCLGQLSVLWPALRAAAVPPATAARAV